MIAVGLPEKYSPLEVELEGKRIKLQWPEVYKSVDHTEEVVEGILDHSQNQDAIEALEMNKGRLFAELVFEVEDRKPWMNKDGEKLLPTLKLSLQVLLIFYRLHISR